MRLLNRVFDRLGFPLGGRVFSDLVVSHSLFADDTLIFCEAHLEKICYVRLILLCFEAVLGLRVNLGKSEIVAIGEVEDIGALAIILGCSFSFFLSKIF